MSLQTYKGKQEALNVTESSFYSPKRISKNKVASLIVLICIVHALTVLVLSKENTVVPKNMEMLKTVPISSSSSRLDMIAALLL